MRTTHTISRRILSALGGAALLCAPLLALAGPQVQEAGPYRITLTTQPGTIPATGRAKLIFKVTDSAGKLQEGVTLRSLTKMPGMNMGEREETAVPATGQPGVYTAPATFAMEGGYEDTVRIEGPLGPATAKIAIATGQNAVDPPSGPSAERSGVTPPSLLPWAGVLILVGALLFVLARMRQTGQSLTVRGVAWRSALGSLLLLGLILWGALYAVGHFRRPGALTPGEAQGMEMNLPAPLGTAPVELATAESGRLESTVRYTGQAVAYVEQEVSPRVTGILTWMPFYAGDRVKRGQLLARLDTSQSAPLLAVQQGQVAVAREGVEVARKDYRQALAQVQEAHAEVGAKRGAIAVARADVTAAEQERANARSTQEAMQSLLTDAEAQRQAAQADQQYWQDEITREAALLKAGAVTQEEYQRERAQAQNADARVRQAQARITQVQAQIRAAQSGVQKSEAGILAAQAKLAQTQSDLEAHNAHVRSAGAAADSAQQKISQAQAGVQQAQGGLASASAVRGYSEIRSQTDGVVTQRILSPGTLVSPGQTLLKIAQISPIRLQANVAEADLQKVQVGGRVLIGDRSDTRKPLAAHITSIAPAIDPTARTGIVEAVLPNNDRRFLPGQYVTLTLATGPETNTLTIPTRALRYHTVPSGQALSSQATPTVWAAEPVPGQKGRYTVQEVTVRTGRSDTDRTEVLAGLTVGQRIVTAGQDYLKPGDTVSVAEPPRAAGDTQAAQEGGQRQGAQEGGDMQGAQEGGDMQGAREGGERQIPSLSGSRGTIAPAAALYTCPMHPEVVREHPGKCPKCGMNLVAKSTGGPR
jgi:RND family efflux transporter MFP subunit